MFDYNDAPKQEIELIPAGMAMVLWTLLCMGPCLNAWCLTGNHRVVKGAMNLGAQQR